MSNQENTTENQVNVQDELLDVQEGQKKVKDSRVIKKWMKGVGISLAILIASYLCVALHYQDRFLINTTINGEACASRKVKVIKEEMQSQVEEYTLVINKANDETEMITGPDIDVKYNGVEVLEAELEKQNPFLWVVALFKPQDIDAELSFSYDKEKLDEVIANLECVKEENQVAPVDAKPVLAEGAYMVQEEVYGTLLDMDAFVAKMHEKAANMETESNLYEEGCYVLPKYTKESSEIIALTDALNKCLTAEVTYSLDGTTVKVDAEVTKDWLSYDENMQLVISTDAISSFVNEKIAGAYNTAPRTNHITTPTGKAAYVAGATVGRQIGATQECEQLLNEIKEGTVITRSPIIAQHATPEGQYAWGNTYAEVDISAQHMWFIQNGQVAMECDVITGKPSAKWDTPAGKFTILEKRRNKTLVGNIDPKTGKPEYETPVEYWARVTWSGVGFHDCYWHSTFGGDYYLRAGSHGCINMPPASAGVFYGMVYVGCPVIIHY